MEKTDFKKELKHLYRATQKIQEVDAGTGKFLVIDGKGAPGGEAFEGAMQKLYGTVYTLKFGLKHAGVMDFAVCSLEGLYFDDPREVSMEEWSWRMMVRVPDGVKQNHLSEAQADLMDRKGVDASDVKLEQFKEGRSIQILHLGPYDQVGPTYEKMEEFMIENELTCNGAAHEVYLSDPRRTAPERIKTIVRLPIK